MSYGESHSIVNYLIQTYGKDNMKKAFRSIPSSSTYDDALRQVYGFDQDGLNSLWRASLAQD